MKKKIIGLLIISVGLIPKVILAGVEAFPTPEYQSYIRQAQLWVVIFALIAFFIIELIYFSYIFSKNVRLISKRFIFSAILTLVTFLTSLIHIFFLVPNDSNLINPYQDINFFIPLEYSLIGFQITILALVVLYFLIRRLLNKYISNSKIKTSIKKLLFISNPLVVSYLIYIIGVIYLKTFPYTGQMYQK